MSAKNVFNWLAKFRLVKNLNMNIVVKKFFLGTRTIIHPGVSIIAEAGPIFIGDGNLIEEQCVIANR